MRNIILTAVVLLASAYFQVCKAQGWVMEVSIDFAYGACEAQFVTSTISFGGNTQTHTFDTPYSFMNNELVFKGTGTFQGTFKLNNEYSCMAPFQSPKYDFTTEYKVLETSNCDLITIIVPPSTTVLDNIEYIYLELYPQLTINNPNASCEGVSLSVNECAKKIQYIWEGQYIWEVSNSPTGTFYPFLTTSSKSINVTADQLHKPQFGSNKYGTRYIRVKDSALEGRTSQAVVIDLYLPGPTVNVTSNPPPCRDGKGSLDIAITPSGSAVTSFKISSYELLNDGTKKYNEDKTIIGTNYQLSDLSPGEYFVQVENQYAGGCKSSLSSEKVITNPTQVTANLTTEEIKCAGANTGKITVTPSGGTGIYTQYEWSLADSTKNFISNLSAGIPYKVRVKDSNSCWSPYAEKTFTSPPPITIQLDSIQRGRAPYEVTCYDRKDGQIIATASGGTGTLSYSWAKTKPEFILANPTSSTISNLWPDKYTLTVTDGNGCIKKDSAYLSAPLKITGTITGSSILDCPGNKTTLQVSNVKDVIGAPSYKWSTGEETDIVYDKPSGDYWVVISDTQGCSSDKIEHKLSDPTPYTVEVQTDSDFNGKPIKCNGDKNGALKAIAKDDKGNIFTPGNYIWNKESKPYDNGATLSTLTNLGAGSYQVSVPYKTGCTATSASFLLNDPLPVSPVIVTTSDYYGQAISCADSTDASVKASASGGTGMPSNYTYLWSTGETGSVLTNIGAGEYSVTATDVNGCTGTSFISIENPDKVEAKITSSSGYSQFGVSCFGKNDGFVNISASGGIGDYTYTMGGKSVTNSIQDLIAGEYEILVSDLNSCKDTVRHTVTSPDALLLQIAEKDNILCFDGSNGKIVLNTTGGVTEYEYTRDNGLSWQSAPSFHLLKSNTYTLEVKDKNGCSTTITTTLTQPTKVVATVSDIVPAYCSDPRGGASATALGGTGNHTFKWLNSGETTVSITDKLLDVLADLYKVTAYDENMCPSEAVPVSISSTDGAKLSWATESVKCFESGDGVADITVTEGAGPFTISWKDNNSNFSRTDLIRGNHLVEVTDANNCKVYETIFIPFPDALQLSVQSEILPTCFSFCDGKMTLQASGGVGNYTYAWNSKSSAYQDNLCAKVYPVTITDGNGCMLHQDVELKQPDQIEVRTLNSKLPTCHDGCDGSLNVYAVGGNGTYTYQWANGPKSNLLTDICPGSYQVSVADIKGCTETGLISLENTPELTVDLGGSRTLCVGQNYTLDVGEKWTQFEWGSNTGFTASEQSVTIKDPGEYWVNVVNSFGCVAKDTFLLETSYDLLKASFLIPQEAHSGDTVVMIDISWPMPENIEWGFPSAMRVLDNSGDVIYGQFNEAGTFDVSLQTYLGECRDKLTKQIMIIGEKEEIIEGRIGYVAYVKEFNLYSNPNDGTFKVEVELEEEGAVTLSVWSFPEGLMCSKVRKTGEKSYLLDFDLRPLRPGVYILRMDHSQGKEYTRFLVY